jgi:hypothetical protein
MNKKRANVLIYHRNFDALHTGLAVGFVSSFYIINIGEALLILFVYL